MASLLRPGEKVVLLGLGEHSRGDRGVGAQVVSALEKAYDLPPNVTVLSAPAPDADLLDALEEAALLVAVDYVYGEATPGTFYRVSLDEYEREADPPESVHEAALLSTLGVMEMLDRRPLGTLFIVQIAELAAGEQLSPAVAATLPSLIEAVAAEIVESGVPLERRRAM